MWDWDIINQDITYNAEYYEILGWDKYRNISNEDFYNLIHPDDLRAVKAEMNSALRGGAQYDAEFRITRHNDQKLSWVKDKGMIEFDENGVPLRGYGAIIDVTEQKLLSHEQLRAAGENYHNLDSISKCDFGQFVEATENA
jgi:PAS domain S-box-containing protein